MSQDGRGERYKWTVLVNTTTGTLLIAMRLSIVFTFAMAVCLVAAAASWLRGSGAAPGL